MTLICSGVRYLTDVGKTMRQTNTDIPMADFFFFINQKVWEEQTKDSITMRATVHKDAALFQEKMSAKTEGTKKEKCKYKENVTL